MKVVESIWMRYWIVTFAHAHDCEKRTPTYLTLTVYLGRMVSCLVSPRRTTAPIPGRRLPNALSSSTDQNDIAAQTSFSPFKFVSRCLSKQTDRFVFLSTKLMQWSKSKNRSVASCQLHYSQIRCPQFFSVESGDSMAPATSVSVVNSSYHNNITNGHTLATVRLIYFFL